MQQQSVWLLAEKSRVRNSLRPSGFFPGEEFNRLYYMGVLNGPKCNDSGDGRQTHPDTPIFSHNPSLFHIFPFIYYSAFIIEPMVLKFRSMLPDKSRCHCDVTPPGDVMRDVWLTRPGQGRVHGITFSFCHRRAVFPLVPRFKCSSSRSVLRGVRISFLNARLSH